MKRRGLHVQQGLSVRTSASPVRLESVALHLLLPALQNLSLASLAWLLNPESAFSH